MGPNNQRKDKYSKLLCRFYEPLILLRVLGQTRGKHTSSPQHTSDIQSKRRRLLKNLAYICDYEKGGETTSAIGLEESEERFVFWVASNADRSRSKIEGFLKTSLKDIKHMLILSEEKRGPYEQKFIRSCITFAKSRITKEMTLFSTAVNRSKRYLDSTTSAATDLQIAEWLRKFTKGSNRPLEDICIQAYEERRGPEMRWLESHTSNMDTGPDASASDLSKVRHYLGRLAAHVRAAKEVIEHSLALDHLFDEYEVRIVQAIPSNIRPEADDHTTLDSILVRMLPKDDARLGEYSESLTSLDRKFQISKRMGEIYEDKNFKPCVHAEIQVLEHFCRHKLHFAQSDSYIGCSKDACYCCHLYFQHHWSRPVAPESHQKIYHKWGVPLLPGGAQDPGWVPQRDMLNRMVETIRKEALDQMTRQAHPQKWHADSETGITVSTMAMPPSATAGRLAFEREMEELNIDTTSLPEEAHGPESYLSPIEELRESPVEELVSDHGYQGEDISEFGFSSDTDSDSGGGAAL
ncbi:hypothetical protein M426DRAFT_261136 [Hypoxylon sp. CI-4A]|nr:hypothetical protein M426DRAFT_261136 [Hypoxylon sp. CI-4A]